MPVREAGMNVKLLWAVIIFLALLVLAEAGYIYKQRAGGKIDPPWAEEERNGYSAKAFDARWKELEKWRAKVHERLRSGTPMLDPDFDGFFDDRFFGRKYSPFTEMERIHRQMLETLRESERVLFDDSWDRWYGRRMQMGRFKTAVTRTEKDVTLTIELPGQAARTADIDITDDRIRISFTARNSAEEKKPGGVTRKESVESHVKILPLPEDAVPGTGMARIDGETVKIRFDRRKAKR